MSEEAIKPLTIISKVKATERYKKYLQIISLFMTKPLTSVEIDVLDELYHTSNGVLTTESRKTIRENINMSPENLNNYIRGLRKKNVIIDETINSRFLITIPPDELFNINLELKVIV
jgi:hypothetical protein